MREFRYVEGSSAKFWRIERAGPVLTIRYGRLGTAGQTQVKDLGSDAAAAQHADKLVAAKVKKGYAEVATAADVQRRSAALAAATARFPAAQERFRRAYGLRLPRHLAVFTAFWDSLNAQERHELAHVGVSPCGVTDYLRPDAADWVARDGLDERLHYRFRRDPPEFVTVARGDRDGLHFGLWYDDPAELPSFVAYNYARDSAETWTSGAATVLAQVRAWMDRARGPGVPLGALTQAVDWFADADADALAQDGERRWADAPRTNDSVTISPALPLDSGDPRAGQALHRLNTCRNDPAAARQWIDEARAELAAGQPAFALVLGAELHWLDNDAHRHDSLELLTGAYRALGRDALADIIEVHVAHRDQRSVDVLAGPPGASAR